METKIPIHDFTKDDLTSIPFDILPLDKKEEYDTSVPHRHNYYEIFLFINGGGTHQIDFEVIPIESKSIHFVSPGQIHQVKRELNSYGYCLFFSRDFYHLNFNDQDNDVLFDMPFLNNNAAKPVINLTSDDFGFFNDLLLKIHYEYEEDCNLKESILRSYLNILFLKSKSTHDKYNLDTNLIKRNGVVPLAHRFKILIEKRFKDLHLVREYADLLSTTSHCLNEETKKFTGKNASDLISDRMVLEIKRLLLYSDHSNKEIAFFMNYDDPAYFSRFCKKKLGCSPSEFRDKHQ